MGRSLNPSAMGKGIDNAIAGILKEAHLAERRMTAQSAMNSDNSGDARGPSLVQKSFLRSDSPPAKLVEEPSSQEFRSQSRHLGPSDSSAEETNPTSNPENFQTSSKGKLRFSLVILSLSLSIFLVAVDRGIVAVAMYCSTLFVSLI